MAAKSLAPKRAFGRAGHMKIEAARAASVAIVARIKQGLPAKEAKPETLAAVAENWLVKIGRGQREIVEKTRRIRKHLLPALGHHVLTDIKKSHVSALLDKIEAKSGGRSADMVRVDLLAIAKWHAERVDDYVVPFGGMAKRDKAKARERVLNPDELRLVWAAADDAGRFGAIIKLLLYTAQRREKVLSMRWTDIDPNGRWTIPKEPGEKGNPGVLVLPPAALDLIEAQDRLASSPWVFPAYRGDGHVRGVDEFKKIFDAKLTAIPNWTLHDLRRTSRTLMTKVKIDFHVAEAIMGHKLPGVAGIYDRHDFAEEMVAALATLAAHIDGIVNPRHNVIPFGPVPAHA